MPRTHAVLLLRVWSDQEWRALPRDCQWLYELLISQPSINHAGVLPLPGRRWQSLAADATPDVVNQALKTLAERRFVAYDEDTDEVLVRSFVRNDGVYRQPNTLKSALRSAQAVQSPHLRAVLASELRRLDPRRLAEMRVSRDSHVPVLDLWRETLAVLDEDQDSTPPNINNATPSEGYGYPIGQRDRLSQIGEGEGVSTSTPAENNPEHTRRQPTQPPDRTRPRNPADLNATAHTVAAHRLVTDYAASCNRRPPTKILTQLAIETDALLAEGWPAPDLARALTAWGAKGLGPGAFQAVAHEVVNRRSPSAQTPLSTTDQRVADAQALKAQFRALPGGTA